MKKTAMGKKVKTSTIVQMTDSFLSDRKNSNNLVQLMTLLETGSNVPACLGGLHKIFSHSLEQKLIGREKDEDLKKSTRTYSKWLTEMYFDTKHKLVELLIHEDDKQKELSLVTLMKFVKAEGHNPVRCTSNPVLFPTSTFSHIVKKMLSCDIKMDEVISRFQEYMEYDDVRYNTMKITLKSLTTNSPTQSNEVYLNNVFKLLDSLSMPVTPNEDGYVSNFLSKYPEKAKGLAINSYAEHKKMFSQLWLKFLENKLPTNLYKTILVRLHENVIPFMQNPLLLSDFLTASYNIGGAISLLALNGIFLLVNQYNLDYPDFYTKLYALLDPLVFHVKYKARFFYLTDLFLTSTHLPAYLVAAFIKRLGRLALSAPPSGLTIIIPLIYNLLIRHPCCRSLLHCSNVNQNSEELNTDPFIADEPDPALCKALESSLWELQCLEEHFYYAISKEAKKWQSGLPKMEMDISELLETTSGDLFSSEANESFQNVATTFEPPSGLFDNKEDCLKLDWVWRD